MDRTIITTAESFRSFDFISFEHDVLIALARAAADLLGSTSTFVSGFAATPDAPADLSINLAAGSIYQLASADATAGGAIPQDLTQILQQGLAAAQKVTLVPPGTSGQSQWNLIQVQFSQVDQVRANDPNGGNPPFYNATNPNSPVYNSVNTERAGKVVVQVVTGTAATTGSEVPPNPTAGWVPLYLIDLAFGQTQITAPEILTAGPLAGVNVPNNYPRAPFLQGLTQQGQFAQDVGTANAYVVQLAPAVTAHVVGMPIRVKIASTNTGASTLNDGAGAASITHTDGSALNAGDLPAGGVVTMTYDGAAFQIETPTSAGQSPTGMLAPFAGAAAPSGWLMCDGSAVSRTTYASLFGVIGSTYGAGDGSTTFNVPDMRGRVAAGNDSATGRLNASGQFTNAGPGSTGGEAAHTLSTTEMPSHNHGVNDPTHSHTVNDPTHSHAQDPSTVRNNTGGSTGTGQAGAGGLEGGSTNFVGSGISLNASGTGISIQNNGGGDAHNTVQPTLIVNYIIKT